MVDGLPRAFRWLVEVVTLKIILFMASAAKWPTTASRKSVRGRKVIRDYGCSAPVLVSARQNTNQHPADRMVQTRSSGKFCIKRSGEIKVGFHGRIFGRFFGFSDFSSLETEFGLSIGTTVSNTRAVFLNARVTVLIVNPGQVSRHFRSAWWSDFFVVFFSVLFF